MQTLTMTRLNRQTAAVLDAVSRGETFKIIRHRKAIGYLTPEPIPKAKRQAKIDWDEHFCDGHRFLIGVLRGLHRVGQVVTIQLEPRRRAGGNVALMFMEALGLSYRRKNRSRSGA